MDSSQFFQWVTFTELVAIMDDVPEDALRYWEECQRGNGSFCFYEKGEMTHVKVGT